MLQSRASQFKVETVLPELANRQIWQIEFKLENLRIIPGLRVQLAQGSLRRVIKYLEPDGRLRMVADLLQFEVDLGEPAEGLSFYDAQLQQDYFIFQKKPFFRNRPVLEQAFTLTVRYNHSQKPEAPPPAVAELTLNRILDRGQFQRMARFILDFPFENACPADYAAGWATDYPLHPPLVSGVIAGTVGYYSGPEYREWKFTQPAGFLIPELLKPCPAGDLVFRAAVRQIDWHVEKVKKLSCEMKIEFVWFWIKPQPVACLIGRDCDDLREVVRLKTRKVIKEDTAEFFKSIRLKYVKDRPGELRVAIKEYREKFCAAGILVSGILSVEAFSVNCAGIEEYCQWDVSWDELISGAVSEEAARPAKVVSRIGAELITYRYAAGELELEILIAYHYQLFQPAWAGVLRGRDGLYPVWAEVLTGNHTFEIPGKTQFVLPGSSLAIHRIESGLTGLQLQAEPGWVKIEGRLETAVYYSDGQRRQRMELFCGRIRESFPWQGIEPGMEFDHAVRLKYDNYRVNGPNILYHYLFEMKLESYWSQEVPIIPDTAPASLDGVDPGVAESVTGEDPLWNFQLETEIELELGVPKEIANYRCLINRFLWRDAGNAVLVEGNLRNELEYWDDEGFFRRELVDYPFWRFLQYPAERPSLSRCTPEIRQRDCQPVKAWPWQKGNVKISLAVELRDAGAKEENDEGLVAEPGGLCQDGRRRCDSVGADQRLSGTVGGEDGMERCGANRFKRL
jgi:hypothetical protein